MLLISLAEDTLKKKKKKKKKTQNFSLSTKVKTVKFSLIIFLSRKFYLFEAILSNSLD